MRPDQVKRLEDLAEKLADAFLVEADPTEWSGDGKLPGDLTQQERGDRYWCKKNAMATGGVLRYVLDIQGKHNDPGNKGAEKDEDDLDAQIKRAQKQADEALARVLNKAKAPNGR